MSEEARCDLALYTANQSLNPRVCKPNLHYSLCWDALDAGKTAVKACPYQYCTTIKGCEKLADTFLIERTCTPDGVWAAPVYNSCLTIFYEYRHCVAENCRQCPDFMRDLVFSTSLTLSMISIALLVTAILLFSMFDSIQCRRLSIHKQLAASFVFRSSVFALWSILQNANVFKHCEEFKQTFVLEYEGICKLIIWFVIYFQVASVIWMLIEGAYLYSRFTVFAMRHSDVPYYMYLLAGWGVPFVVVSVWTVVHELNQVKGSYCWIPYTSGQDLWILAGTIGFAIIMNLIFLLAIVVILVQKLGSENSAESKKIWRTIKATLLLFPLLGVSNIPLFYEPTDQTAIYMLGSAILQHSQGIFIAVLYCFLNNEIQHAARRQLSKVPFMSFLRRNHFETERTYVPEPRGHQSNKHGVPMGELNGAAILAPDTARKQESLTSTTTLIKPEATPVHNVLTPPPTGESTSHPPPPPPNQPLIPLEPLEPTTRTASFNPLMVGSIKSIDATETDSGMA